MTMVAALAVAPAALAATPPTPTYGAATIDGNPVEWDLTNDLYAPMYNAGDPAKAILANGYLRYDCTTGTLDVLVLQQGYGTGTTIPLLTASGNAWAEFDGGNTKLYTDSTGTNAAGTAPEFAWIGNDHLGDAQGYEASFPISPGHHTIVAHVEALYNGNGSTAAFEGFSAKTATTPLDIPASCTNAGGTTNPGGGTDDGGGTTPPAADPSIGLVKETNGVESSTSPGSRIPVGAAVNWTYDVTNTGDVSLSDVAVSDSDSSLNVTCPNTTLDAGASMTCTASGDATAGQYENTGSVTAQSDDGTQVNASETNYYYGVQDVNLAYDNAEAGDPASTTYARTFNWTLSKTVGPAAVVKQVGGSATFNYAVTAAEAGYTDGSWQLAGKIDLTNPNDVALHGITVTDSVDDSAGSCQVTNGSSVELPANGAVTLDYTCTWSSAPSTSGTDTATATWDAAANGTPNDSSSVNTPYSFGAPATVNNPAVTVSDSYAGTLGSLTGVVSGAYPSSTYTYSRTIAVPAHDCTSYPNTATLVETGQTASRTVTVCGPALTGALTIGFWQNKNGQGIIGATSQSAGVCALTAFLGQYAPFRDLSPSASCSAAAAYVTTVIKGANAGNATMNAMLKAQMLATALDVFYSAPGRNAIGAPVAIGTVAVDLTKVGRESDTSSGGGTPSGAYEDDSAAFGGSSGLPVSEMLAAAAGQSNAGGSSWYGNVKAAQQLAKDAFDAVNNGAVFPAT